MNTDDFDFCFKYILLGDSGAGKTSILTAFCENEHMMNYNCTIGVDFKNMVIPIPKYNKKVKLHIWDTAGQEKFLSIVKSYFREITVCIFVYDINNYQSFTNIKNWIEELDNHCNNLSLKVLVGNKIDLKKDQVMKNDIDKLAKKYDMINVFSSAKENINIQEIFIMSAEQIIHNIQHNNIKDLSSHGIKQVVKKKMSQFSMSDKKIQTKCCTIL